MTFDNLAPCGERQGNSSNNWAWLGMTSAARRLRHGQRCRSRPL